MSFMVGCVIGAAVMYFWPQIKAKLLAWYDALVAKI